MAAAQQAVTEYRVDASGATETLARLQEAADKATAAQERQALGLSASANRTERAWQSMQAKTDPVYRAQIAMNRELDRVAKLGAEAQDRLGISAQEVARTYATTRQHHEKQIENLRQQALAAHGIVPANDAAANSNRRMTSEFERSNSVIERLRGTVSSLVLTYASMQGLRMLGGLADEWSELQARVNNAAGSMDAGAETMGRITEMARRTYSDLSRTAESWLSNATALTELGYSTSQQLDLTETLNNAMVVSATRGQRAESVMRAWSDAMALGELRGDNLNRVMTGSDRLAKALAASMGVSTNELRKLGADGKITTDVMFNVTSQLERLRKEADEMPPTLGDAATLFRNAMLAFVGGIDQATKTSEGFSNVVITLADNFEHLVRVISVIAVTAIGRSIGIMTASMVEYASQQFAAVAAARQVALAEQQAAAGRLRSAETALAAARANSQLSASYLIAKGNVDAARVSLAAADAQLATTTVRARAATAAMTGLSRAMAFFGGPIGLGLTAVALGVSLWATRADKASAAMEAHRSIVETVKKAYDEAGGATENWANKVAETTLLQAEANATSMRELARQAREGASVSGASFTLGQLEGEARKQAEALRDLQNEFVRLGGNVDDYKKRVDQLGQAALADEVRDYATAMLTAADGLKQSETAADQAEAVLRVLRGTASDADRALLGLGGSADAAGGSMRRAAGDARNFGDAMRELGRLIPEVAAAQRAHEQLGEATKNYQSGLADLRREQQAGNVSAADYLASRNALIERYRQAQDEVSGLAAATRQLDQVEASNRIAGLSGRTQAVARVTQEYAEREATIRKAIQHGATHADVSAALARNEQQLAVALANTNAQYDTRDAKAAASAKKSPEQKADDKYLEMIRDAQQFIAAQEIEQRALHLTEEAAAALRYEQELLNEAKRIGIELSPQQEAALGLLADAMARAEGTTARLSNRLNFARDIARGFFGDVMQSLRDGASVWDAFANAGLNALDKIMQKLIDMALDQMINGFLRNLMGAFGGGFGFPVAPMGGGGLANGGRSGLWANGGAFDSGTPIPFAKGGAFTNSIVNKPTVFPFANGIGLMGEAGPEAIMPLRRGADGRLGVSAPGGRAANQNVRVEVEVFVNDDGTLGAIAREAGREGGADVAVKAVKKNNELRQKHYQAGGQHG